MLRKMLLGLTGIASVVLSIVCFCFSTGGYESSYTYGGDAYTGIQNAAAQTANNVSYLGDIAKFGFGSILLIAGILMILYAIFYKEKKDYSEALSGIDTKILVLNANVLQIEKKLKTEEERTPVAEEEITE